ncbi:MAG: hypothetical protein AAF358_11950 [Pseudomonadota bacterium]
MVKAHLSTPLLLLLATLAALLPAGSADAKKVYIELNEAVAQCADQCNVVKMQCRAHAKDQYDYCKAVFREQQRQFNWCRRQGGNCIRPQRCPVLQTKGCTINYDLCFESCGGVIEDSKELKKRQKAEERAAREAAKDEP